MEQRREDVRGKSERISVCPQPKPSSLNGTSQGYGHRQKSTEQWIYHLLALCSAVTTYLMATPNPVLPICMNSDGDINRLLNKYSEGVPEVLLVKREILISEKEVLHSNQANISANVIDGIDKSARNQKTPATKNTWILHRNLERSSWCSKTIFAHCSSSNLNIWQKEKKKKKKKKKQSSGYQLSARTPAGTVYAGIRTSRPALE